jgi:hypothetical protein
MQLLRVACRAVSRQRLGKHVLVATDTLATVEVLLEMVFSIRSVHRTIEAREPPFREGLSPEPEE